MKFTPGPWKIKYRVNVEAENGRGIASAGGHSDNTRCEEVDAENQANAHLIAAAPKMYEALEWLVNLASGVSRLGGPVNEEWETAWRTAEQALRKAGGTE